MTDPPAIHVLPSTPANRRYTIALLVLVFFLLIAAGDGFFMGRLHADEPILRFVFEVCAFTEGAYVFAIAITLCLRTWAPDIGRTATVALNILLLLMFPIGTAIGIYGLSKVDKPPKSASV